MFLNTVYYYQNKHSEGFFRILYSALKTSSKIHLHDQKLTPCDNITNFIYTDIKLDHSLVFDADIPEKYNSCLSDIKNQNLKFAIFKLISSFEHLGYTFHYVERGEFHTQLVLELNNEINKIDIYTKGKKYDYGISKIMLSDNVSKEFKEIFDKTYDDLVKYANIKCHSANDNSNQLVDFSYDYICDICNLKKISLNMIERGQYFDIIQFKRGDDFIVSKFTYNSSGMFSKIEIIKFNEQKFVDDLEKLLISK